MVKWQQTLNPDLSAPISFLQRELLHPPPPHPPSLLLVLYSLFFLPSTLPLSGGRLHPDSFRLKLRNEALLTGERRTSGKQPSPLLCCFLFPPSSFPSKLDESLQKAVRRSGGSFATFPLASGNEVSLCGGGRGSGGFSPERRAETAIRMARRTAATSSQPEVHAPASEKLDRAAPLEDSTLSPICVSTGLEPFVQLVGAQAEDVSCTSASWPDGIIAA